MKQVSSHKKFPEKLDSKNELLSDIQHSSNAFQNSSLASNHKDLLTTKEIMNYLSISRTTVYNWVIEGKLPKIKVGVKTVRYRFKDVEALLFEMEGKRI